MRNRVTTSEVPLHLVSNIRTSTVQRTAQFSFCRSSISDSIACQIRFHYELAPSTSIGEWDRYMTVHLYTCSL